MEMIVKQQIEQRGQMRITTRTQQPAQAAAEIRIEKPAEPKQPKKKGGAQAAAANKSLEDEKE